MQLMQSDKYMSDGSSGRQSNSDLSSTEFDSDGGSKISSIPTESLPDEEQCMFDEEPVGRLPGEVDLTGFHDVCRKILAKKIPEGFTTGWFSGILSILFFGNFVAKLKKNCQN